MDWTWLSLLEADDYTIAREVLQRGVAAIYGLAFLSTYHQFPALLGERGLTPAPRFLERTRGRDAPTLFRLLPYGDRLLRTVCAVGMALALAVIAGLPQLGPPWLPLLAFLAMWGLYLSIVNVGQRFYGFGWETLLLEAGFVVALLGSPQVAPPLPILLFLRWLVFRLEFGAGMIKMRGDAAWRDLTAMDYHHQTQPMPNPLSRWAHRKPAWWHRAEALGSHAVQLVVPWLLFLPQPVASIAACLIILTQLYLVLTGNYAWLNWLTILLAFSAISDSFLRALLGGPWEAALAFPIELGDPRSPAWWTVLVALVFLVLLGLSAAPLRNLCSKDQRMNASFNRLHLVNAYGAFGSMTKQRRELVIEGSIDPDPGEDDWRAYEFQGKPGDPRRMPRQFAPYHLRLDWLLWFAALGRWREPWFNRLLEHLLEGDPAILRLLRTDPFEGRAPAVIRVRVFEYRFASARERRETGLWWLREELGTLLRARHSTRGTNT